MMSNPSDASQHLLLVVADTSALEAEGWDLSSEPMRIVEHECAQGHFSLCLPDVALRELKAHGGESARKAASRLNQDTRTLWQVGELSARPEPRGLHATYGQHLDRRLAAFSTTVLTMPTVRHEELVDRAVLLRKPFRDKGRGYKDALIWYSVLELLQAGQAPIAFVAADGDFRDGDDLAADLKRDVERLGFGDSDIRLYRTFSELVTTEVPNIHELQTRFALRIQGEHEFREHLLALMIAAADEDGPTRLEPSLVNIRLLRPLVVEYGSFEPVDQPYVLGALAANEHESYEVALKGLVKVILQVEGQPPAATPVSFVTLTDDVEVEYSFRVAYDPRTQVIKEVRLIGVRSLATNILGLPRA